MKNRSYSVDLIRQMAECDANYIRLLKLIPALRNCRDGAAGTPIARHCKVGEFVIADRHDGRGGLTNPCMQVRIYHDASTAEVTSYQNHRNFKPHYAQPNPAMYQRDEKVQVNRFLGEWLTLCLQAGRSLKVPDIAFS